MAHSPVPIRMIHVYYRDKGLQLLDSDNTTQLYRVDVNRKKPQFDLRPISASTKDGPSTPVPGDIACSATFSAVSFAVHLELHGQSQTMRRPHMFTRTYEYEAPSLNGQKLAWEADGALSGDYRLVDRADDGMVVLARFHSKLLSRAEIGCFEIIGVMEDRTRDEAIITGLAELVMMQSLNLASIAFIG